MKFNIDILMEMLDIAIGAINENELCSYCIHCNDCSKDKSNDECKNAIYRGLQQMAIEAIKKSA